MKVDRDFALLLNAYDIDPGSLTPRVNTMLDFDLWTWNSRMSPGIAHLVARTGDRVRIRCGNLSMTNHPMHLHGHHFEVTGTDGGWVPKAARWPEVSAGVAVAQMRAIEFDAIAGDRVFHCHKAHHTMNAMGHDVPTMIGVDQRDMADKIRKLLPDYMAMGDRGMADMGEMEMPLPDNTLPMMTGRGPFGASERAGCSRSSRSAPISSRGTMLTLVGTRIRPEPSPGNGSARHPNWSRPLRPTRIRKHFKYANHPTCIID